MKPNDPFEHFKELASDEKAVDVNCSDEEGSTPLMLLCRHSQNNRLYDCIAFLLQRPDIDVNQTNKEGINALMWLCAYSKSDKIVELVQMLIDKGADVNQTDRNGRTALMWLCENYITGKLEEVAKLLITKGCMMNSSDNGAVCKKFQIFETENDGLLKVCQCATKPCFLGEGSKGRVYRGHWTNNSKDTITVTNVAVKFVPAAQTYQREIQIIKKVIHRNILKYYFEEKYGPNR